MALYGLWGCEGGLFQARSLGFGVQGLPRGSGGLGRWLDGKENGSYFTIQGLRTWQVVNNRDDWGYCGGYRGY